MSEDTGAVDSRALLEAIAEKLGATFRSAREGGFHQHLTGPLIHTRKHVQFDLEINGRKLSCVCKDNYATGYGGSTTSSGVYTLLEDTAGLEVHVAPKDVIDAVMEFFCGDDIKLGDADFDKRFYVKGEDDAVIRRALGNGCAMSAIERACGISVPIYFEIRNDPDFIPFDPPIGGKGLLAGFETRLTWITDREEISILFRALGDIVRQLEKRSVNRS